MLCERSYDPLSRMLLKGDEGDAKFGGGWPKMAIFARGVSPLPARHRIEAAHPGPLDLNLGFDRVALRLNEEARC